LVSAACRPAADDLLAFGDHVLGGDMKVWESAAERGEDLPMALAVGGLPGEGVVVDEVGCQQRFQCGFVSSAPDVLVEA